MLNCLSQKPVEEINPESDRQLLYLLLKHLEYIPMENPQHMVRYSLTSA